MMKNKIYTMTLVLVIIDQITKFFIKSNMNLYDKIKIIPNFFSIYYVENSGAAFSILENVPYILIIISVIVLLFLIYYIRGEYNNIDLLSSISFSMILSGIIGNLIDRCLYGKVIDFLSFKIINYQYPVFNMADTFIVVGVILLVIDYIFEERMKLC